jgi:hypothetical protein
MELAAIHSTLCRTIETKRQGARPHSMSPLYLVAGAMAGALSGAITGAVCLWIASSLPSIGLVSFVGSFFSMAGLLSPVLGALAVMFSAGVSR